MKLFRNKYALYAGVFSVSVLFSVKSFSQVTFLPYQALTTGSRPEVTAIADVNNDGLNDVLLGTSFFADSINDYKLFVYYQNGSGGLNSPVKYPYPSSGEVLGITTGDFNNDGLRDVTIGYGDSIGIFFQNTSGTLDPIVSFYSGWTVDCVKAGDLNNDGLTDMAVSNWNNTFITLFYQDAGGGFIMDFLPSIQSGYDEIDVGDVNNDNLDDIVFMAGQSYSALYVYTQIASGGFNSFVSYFPPVSLYNRLNGMALGDLNNDGRIDMTATVNGNTPNSKIVLWYQDSISGLMQNPVPIPAYDIPEPVEVFDLNCDGKNEIIVCNGGWNAFSIFEQDSQGNYNTYQTYYIPYASHYKPQGLSIGDYNNDGKPDIAIADYNSGLICLYNNTPVSCNPSSANNINAKEKSFNLFPNPTSGNLSIHFNNNTSEKTIQIFDVTGNIIYEKKKIKNSEAINLTGASKSIYFLKVFDEDKISTHKIVIQ